ncbi:HIT domain-containing protein [Patescibacteria group bacterium]|nr:HIT domain-containing protein [Patescibacteria group bacterium]MDE1946969.1 HIT domain-containing protein [Patescibacteria group bacterium]MDE2011242.1 HIT domain-containing protein [Patescibacteria group bacterium]MDE2233406.1 HIT domain-containing protein [Patescibacteria group bacterium]
MKDCTYCTLPEIKARKVAENDLAIAFPTNIPITPGHMLVIPKRCVARYEDLTKEEKEAIESLRVKIVTALKKVFNADGFNFAWNDGKVAGQSILHFHLHIIQRKKGDAGIFEYEPRKFIYRPGERETSPEEELLEISKLVREAMA